jgi:hypothetical protein
MHAAPLLNYEYMRGPSAIGHVLLYVGFPSVRHVQLCSLIMNVCGPSVIRRVFCVAVMCGVGKGGVVGNVFCRGLLYLVLRLHAGSEMNTCSLLLSVICLFPLCMCRSRAITK